MVGEFYYQFVSHQSLPFRIKAWVKNSCNNQEKILLTKLAISIAEHFIAMNLNFLSMLSRPGRVQKC
jgi:hypothetical protein